MSSEQTPQASAYFPFLLQKKNSACLSEKKYDQIFDESTCGFRTIYVNDPKSPTSHEKLICTTGKPPHQTVCNRFGSVVIDDGPSDNHASILSWL